MFSWTGFANAVAPAAAPADDNDDDDDGWVVAISIY